jgi:DNA-binding MarR family transcriptional regulator
MNFMTLANEVKGIDDASKAARPQGCTNFQLRQLMRRVAQHYDLEMSHAGLKTTQYSLLSHVLKLGPIRPGELAVTMTMEPSTLTRNLKPLLVAGWVELTPDADGRSRRATITAAGRLKRAEAQRCWKAAQGSLNQTLGIERVVALHALMQESLELLKPVEAQADHV